MKLEEWVEHHRREGHHPRPAPTRENPERWDCDCRTIWRILTPEQIRLKFAHLGRIAAARRQGIPAPWEKDPVWAERVRQAKAKHAHERAQFYATERGVDMWCETCQQEHRRQGRAHE
jgi:hypothetical protein